VSPDGTRLAFVAISPDGTRLIWMRDLDLLTSRPIAGTSGVSGTPFWSPDGRFIGFFAHGQLKKIHPAGGPPETLCDASGAVAGSWSERDDILFAALDGDGLRRVSARGGTPEYVTQLERSRQETSHRYPQFLPDSRHFLYLVRSTSAEHRGTFVGSLGSRDRKRVLADDTAVAYEPPASPSVRSGHLLFVRETTLMAQPFDSDRLELTGEALPVASEVPLAQTVRKAPFSVAGGTLVYRSAGLAISQLVWLDRAGKALGTVDGPDTYREHRLSPDGRQIVFSLVDRQTRKTDLWVLDVTRGIRTRLTSGPGDAEDPSWSPDGTRVAFSSNRSGAWNLYVRELIAGAREELLFKRDDLRPGSQGFTPLQEWSRDGRWLVFSAGDVMTGMHLWALPLDTRKPVLTVPAEFNETEGRLSPDSHWIAYTSDESGAREIYLQRFPSSGPKLRASVAGGREPSWRGDGKELFFISSDGNLMATPVHGEQALELGMPRALFNLGSQRDTFSETHYDATPDGQRFLVERLLDANSRSALTVVVNWTAALKK
jgi:Tol biopolymer transport system component